MNEKPTYEELAEKIKKYEQVELKQSETEKEMRKSEKRYRRLFESTNDGICLHEIIYKGDVPVDYKILDVNLKYEIITGVSRYDAIGAFGSDLYGSSGAPYLDIYADVACSGIPSSFETYFKPMDKYFQISVFSPEKHQFATVFQDITAYKKFEESLKESEERFRLTYYTTPDSVNINRLEDGLFVDINQGFSEMTGYTREEVIGKTSLELNIWDDPADRKKMLNILHDNGYLKNFEAQFRLKDRTVITGLMSANIITLQKDPHIISITRDVSEQKQIQKEKEDLITELQTTLAEVKTLRGFIPICAHCKKIRDDKGYWEQLENYISKKTDALFSHSICPECKVQLYPDLDQ